MNAHAAAFESDRIQLLRRSAFPYVFPLILAIVGCVVVWIWTPHGPMLGSVLHVGEPIAPPPLIAGEPPLLHKAEIFSRTLWSVWERGRDVVPEQRRLASYLPYEIVGLVATLVALSIFQVNPFAVRRRGKLVIDERGATWKGRRLFTREGIEQGLLRPGPRAVGVIVRLERKGWLPRVVELLCDDIAEARRILWSLRFDAAQYAATFRIASLASTHALLGPIVTALRIATILVVGLLAISLGSYAFHALNAAVGIALGVVLLVLFLLRNWPVKVTVGTDGVLVRWLVVERFVPFPVRDVDAYDWGVKLVRHEGEGVAVDLCIFRAPWYVPKRVVRAIQWVPLWLSVQRDLLQARIDQAMAARVATHAQDPTASSQAPGDAAAWARQQRSDTTEARALGSEVVDWVEDPWAKASLRAAAAIDLWWREPPADASHLRALADQTANPPLRALFSALATGNREKAREMLVKLGVSSPLVEGASRS